jgi:hypothetical protein
MRHLAGSGEPGLSNSSDQTKSQLGAARETPAAKTKHAPSAERYFVMQTPNLSNRCAGNQAGKLFIKCGLPQGKNRNHPFFIHICEWWVEPPYLARMRIWVLPLRD